TQSLDVAHRHVAGTAAVAQEGVLRTSAGIVQSGGDRVRLHYLPLLVLHHGRARAVQDARAPAHRQGRAVARGVEPLPARLHTDQLDALVIYEGGERPDRV